MIINHGSAYKLDFFSSSFPLSSLCTVYVMLEGGRTVGEGVNTVQMGSTTSAAAAGR